MFSFLLLSLYFFLMSLLYYLVQYIPPSFKLAAITPVFKSGDRTTPSNYHPISLTSIFSKVLERIIRKQVSSFIDKKGCLNSTQHGFRSGRSCLSASWPPGTLFYNSFRWRSIRMLNKLPKYVRIVSSWALLS